MADTTDNQLVSLRTKDATSSEKNYLNRILNLPVCSYARNIYSDVHYNNMIQVGTTSDYVINTFDGNCLQNVPKFLSTFVCPIGPTCQICTICNPPSGNSYVNPDTLVYYIILAFQSYVSQTNATLTSLQSQITALQNKS